MVEDNANLVRWMHITPWKQDIESCDRVGLIQAMQALSLIHISIRTFYKWKKIKFNDGGYFIF